MKKLDLYPKNNNNSFNLSQKISRVFFFSTLIIFFLPVLAAMERDEDPLHASVSLPPKGFYIPEDIISIIFSHLFKENESVENIRRAALTCKRWYLLSQGPELLKIAKETYIRHLPQEYRELLLEKEKETSAPLFLSYLLQWQTEEKEYLKEMLSEECVSVPLNKESSSRSFPHVVRFKAFKEKEHILAALTFPQKRVKIALSVILPKKRSLMT